MRRRRVASHLTTTKTGPRGDDALVSSLQVAVEANRKLQAQWQRRWKELQRYHRKMLHYPLVVTTNAYQQQQQQDDSDLVPCHTTPRHVILFYRAAMIAQQEQESWNQYDHIPEEEEEKGGPNVGTIGRRNATSQGQTI